MFETHGLTVTPTTTLAVSMADVKDHLNIDGDEGVLGEYIAAATEQVEHDTARSFINKTHVMKLDGFPHQYKLGIHGDIAVPVAPLVSVTSIAYLDHNGTSQTWSDYDVDTASEPGRISPSYNLSYPTARDVNNAITITFVAGYGTTEAAVPARAKQLIKMLVSEFWLHRELGCMSEAFRVSYESMIRRLEWTFYG